MAFPYAIGRSEQYFARALRCCGWERETREDEYAEVHERHTRSSMETANAESRRKSLSKAEVVTGSVALVASACSGAALVANGAQRVVAKVVLGSGMLAAASSAFSGSRIGGWVATRLFGKERSELQDKIGRCAAWLIPIAAACVIGGICALSAGGIIPFLIQQTATIAGVVSGGVTIAGKVMDADIAVEKGKTAQYQGDCDRVEMQFKQIEQNEQRVTSCYALSCENQAELSHQLAQQSQTLPLKRKH